MIKVNKLKKTISKIIKFEDNNRIFYLDQLRVLSLMAIIVMHVTGPYLSGSSITSFNWFIADIFSSFSRFGVPVFLMLSGSLLLNKKYTISEFLKKRYPCVLIPFAFWVIIYIIFTVLFLNNFHFTSLSNAIIFFGKMLLETEGIFGHFWFVWLILTIYLIVPVINKWISNSSIREIEYFLFIW